MSRHHYERACVRCGKSFMPSDSRRKVCPDCWEKERKERKAKSEMTQQAEQ
jgi:NMD protein affecting ribosome stability and mRNA decay